MAREDSETVVSIHQKTRTFMLSTNMPGLAARCTAKWGKGEVFNDEDGKPHRWVWRDLDDSLVRITPKSQAEVEAAIKRGKEQYAARGGLGPVSGGDSGEMAT